MASLLGTAYDSSDDDEAAAPTKPSIAVVAAPDVSVEDPMKLQLMLGKPGEQTMTFNVPYEDMVRPISGPQNPFKAANAQKQRQNALTGHAQETAISETTFRAQQRTFEALGYARNIAGDGAGGAAYVGDLDAAELYGGKDVIELKHSKERTKQLKRKRQSKGDSSIVDGAGAYLGPWAKYRDVDKEQEQEAAAARAALEEAEEIEEIQPVKPIVMEGADSTNAHGESTEFHGTEERDYMGRTYMHVPQDLKIDLKKEVGSVKNYVPKAQFYAWKGHGKGVTSLNFFPNSGHLLLSSGAEGKVKLWDVYHQRDLLRTYLGHSKAITDTSFHPTGERFLSGSYDRNIKLWDTETGQVISRFSSGKIPHVVRFNPSADKGHEFLAGMSDKKILQFDSRTGSVVQEYDYHLGSVNTLTFVEDGQRFLSTSDDKSLRAWEYGLPVPIKYIAEPYMFSLIRAAKHPSGRYVAYQSMDNQIVVYSATNKFRQERKKAFRGHNNAGYPIDLDISPDGNILMSGDSGGYVCFWDWNNCKMWDKFKVGDSAVVCSRWHPQETSVVVCGTLDGQIVGWR